jgi:hypothetical protein
VRYILPDVELLSRARTAIVSIQADINRMRQVDAPKTLISDQVALLELIASLLTVADAHWVLAERVNRTIADWEV